MVVVFVEDGKTGVEYKVVVSEVVKSVPVGFSNLTYHKYFEVRIHEPVLKIFNIRVYKHIKTSLKNVNDVSSVSDLVIAKVRDYLESIQDHRSKIVKKKELSDKNEQEMLKKYDSLPHKITLT